MPPESRSNIVRLEPSLNPENTLAIRRIVNTHMGRYKTHDTEILSRELLGEVGRRNSPFTPTNLDIVNTAINIAGRAHEEKKQIRMFTGDKYLVHPLRVAFLANDLAKALNLPVTPELIVGAILHDVPEDNENYTREVIKNAFQQFDPEKPGISDRIANDAEAFNHNNPTRDGRINSEPYRDKLIDTRDIPTLLVRILVKIADRLDNLLDPPLPPEKIDLFPEEYVEKRLNFIQRTEDPSAIIQLLLAGCKKLDIIDPNIGNFLNDVIKSFVFKSKQTLQPGFNPEKAKK